MLISDLFLTWSLLDFLDDRRQTYYDQRIRNNPKIKAIQILTTPRQIYP